MFKDTARRIDFWESKIEELEQALAEGRAKYEAGKIDIDDLAYIEIDLAEAKAELNYAWQDDELEENGLR